MLLLFGNISFYYLLKHARLSSCYSWNIPYLWCITWTFRSLSDFKNELRSLNRELQLHILELADVLVERPSQYARRVEDISLIFKNLHHLLNSLRPHQVEFFYNSSSVLSMNSVQSTMQVSVPFPCFRAFFMNSVLQGRATLIHLLESQIQRRKQAVEDIKRYGSVTLIEVFRVIEMKSLTSGYVAFENVVLEMLICLCSLAKAPCIL